MRRALAIFTLATGASTFACSALVGIEEGHPAAASLVTCPSDMVAIPAGTFLMGSTDGKPDERPVHSVHVASFCMDRTEVTVDKYGPCASGASGGASGCTYATPSSQDAPFCNLTRTDLPPAIAGTHPINCVSRLDAEVYCSLADKRLPTEQEWEYAARGSDGRTYPWGNAEPTSQLCWQQTAGTCPVGSVSGGTSPFGLYDMGGNVHEWVSGGYSETYTAPLSTTLGVLRGGSWNSKLAPDVRSPARTPTEPTYHGSAAGFRCAR